MSIRNSPFEKYEIEKSASKVRGLKVFLSNIGPKVQKSQNYHIYELNCDFKHSQYILDLLTPILQKFTKSHQTHLQMSRIWWLCKWP